MHPRKRRFKDWVNGIGFDRGSGRGVQVSTTGGECGAVDHCHAVQHRRRRNASHQQYGEPPHRIPHLIACRCAATVLLVIYYLGT